MNTPPRLALLWLLMLAPLAQAHAAAPSSVSVVDFFHLLCDARKLDLIISDRSWLLDPKKGAIIDLPNGYLRTHGDGGQATYTLALFRRPDQSPVVVIIDNHADPFFEELQVYTLDSKGRPVDVTKKLWPLKLPKDGANGPITRYHLPRYGRTIAVVTQPADLSDVFHFQASVAWNKDRFVIEPND